MCSAFFSDIFTVNAAFRQSLAKTTKVSSQYKVICTHYAKKAFLSKACTQPPKPCAFKIKNLRMKWNFFSEIHKLYKICFFLHLPLSICAFFCYNSCNLFFRGV